jgi:hypothetical protein
MSFALLNRTIGQFQISIATSLAIESALGVHPDISVPNVPIESYNALYINVRTLVRNFIGAVEKDALNSIHPNEVMDFVSHEMSEITDVIKTNVNKHIDVVFYFSEYKDLSFKYPYSFLRVNSTDKQTQLAKYLQAVFLELLKRHTKPDAEIKIHVYPLKLSVAGAPRALIISHYPYDLLSYYQFEKLSLLESHTGQIKERSKWYTKYYQGKDLFRIPFREDLLQVFGDAELFKPFPKANRDELVEIAEKRSWTSVTTRDKIKNDINLIKDPFFKKVLKEILI